jgi:threonyl-tRNA synthetase
VKELFPEAQVTIGPVIEDGFYYDFAFKRPSRRKIWPPSRSAWRTGQEGHPGERARNAARRGGEILRLHRRKYKAEIIGAIPAGQTISLYRQGDFIDLCRGPHVPSTGKLKVFKLMKVAGAYWRGDSKQRDAAAHLRHLPGRTRTT